MTEQHIYEWWRLFNIAIALLSLVLNGTKIFGTPFSAMQVDQRLGFLWAWGMNAAYLFSTGLYMTLDGTAGPWSFIWTFPLLMGVYAGLIGRGRHDHRNTVEEEAEPA